MRFNLRSQMLLVCACGASLFILGFSAAKVSHTEITKAQVDPTPVALNSDPVNTKSYSYAQIWQGNPTSKKIALTFDDGPHATYTESVLDILKEKRAKATFFLIGRNVDACPEIAREILADGHELANHTYNHIRLTGQPRRVIERELREGANAIFKATGFKPSVFRTPGGGYSVDVLDVAQEMNMTMAQWSANSFDATAGNGTNAAAAIVKHNILKQARNGAIVLLHEPAFGTLDILAEVIDELREQGYEFVTLEEMMRDPGARIDTFDSARARGNFSPRDYVFIDG